MRNSYPAYPYGGVGIFKNFLGIEFSLSHSTNTGAAWGMFSDYTSFLVVIRILLIIGLAVYFFFYNRNDAFQWPLALIISGAIGNVVDFFVYGYVIDMIHFVFWGYDYPLFNIADSCIFVGVACWIFLSFFEKYRR